MVFACGFAASGNSQNCHCSANLLFLEHSVEQDYSGFQDKVNASNIRSYDQFKDSLLRRVDSSSVGLPCYRLLQAYLRFFHEPHLNIFIRTVNGYLDSLRSMFRNEPRVPINIDSLKGAWASGSGAPLEGIWKLGDTYQLALIKDLATPGDYIGVVLKADSICWFPGQVKIRVKSLPGNKFDLTFYGRDHTPLSPMSIVRPNSIIIDGYGTLTKVFPQADVGAIADSVVDEPVSFRVLSKDACLLTIRSFDQALAKTTDSLIKANRDLIVGTENLIIDLRGNGGGVSDSFFSLFPLIYTKSIPLDDLYLRSSQGNIDLFQKFLENPALPRVKKEAMQDFIDSLKAQPGKMVLVRKGSAIELDSILQKPKRIGVLIDYGCASATEAFLIDCHYSSKVTMFGSRTHGALDHTEVGDYRSMPCPYIYYLCPVGKRGLKIYPAIDNIGIQPDVKLDASTPNWIAYVENYLTREGNQ